MIKTITSSQGRPVENAFYRITILITVACIIGGIVSLAAIAFLESVAFLNTVLFVAPHTRIQIQDSYLLGLVTVSVPTLGGLLVGRSTSSRSARLAFWTGIYPSGCFIARLWCISRSVWADGLYGKPIWRTSCQTETTYTQPYFNRHRLWCSHRNFNGI